MMKDIGFVICNSYSRELKYVIEKLKLTETEVSVLPSTCSSTNLKEREFFADKYAELESKTQNIRILMSNSCTGCANTLQKKNKQELNCPSFCLENFVPPKLLDYYIEQNYYIVSVGWLLQWRHVVIDRWGFNKETASLFFKESTNKILVLDSGIYNNYQKELEDFSGFIDLSYTILPIGLDYFENYIENIVYKFRIGQKENQLIKSKQEASQRISEYAMIIDLIPVLYQLNSEKLVIDRIFDLFTLLFAPEKLLYLVILNNEAQIVHSKNAIIDEQEQFIKLCNFEGNYIYTKDNKGFIFRIIFDNQVFGYIMAENIQFPEHIQRYVNLALSLTSLLGLLVSNSRQFQELEVTKNKAENGKLEYQSLSKKYKRINIELGKMNLEYEALNEELKQSLDEIKFLNDNLAEKNKRLNELIATKDKVFSIIVHDIKNPFSVLFVFSRMLVEDAALNASEEAKQLAQNIYDVSKQTYYLLSNLLEWSKLQRGTISPNPVKLNLKDLINDVKLIYEPVAHSKGIDLKSEPYDDIIFADKDMLLTSLRNIVSNAIKFTRKDGIVRISVQISKEEVLFKISDTGIGIDPKDIDKIFDISSKLSRPGTANETGTGLGLILCKEFVEKQGGRIWVESELGKGTTFYFTIKQTKY